MKRLLRHAACVTAMLLLIVSPVKALAANITQVQDHVGVETSPDQPTKGNEGHSTFKIEQIDRYQYTFLTVMDGEDRIPLSGVQVTFTYGSPAQSVEGFQGAAVRDTSQPGNVTGPDGKIWFRFPKGQTTCHVKLVQDGFVPFDQSFDLTGKRTDLGELSFEPIFYPVHYKTDWHGKIPAGQEETKARWGRAPKLIPAVEVNSDYALVYWIDQDKKQVKDPNQLEVYKDMSLTAHYSRRYLVKYVAGDYGYLDGDTQEHVIAGQKPQHVPTPVPMTQREYWFVKWRLGNSFSSQSIDPGSIEITRDTTFEAIFDVRKHQPVIIKTPPAETNPAPLQSESAAAAPAVVPAAGGKGSGSGSGHSGGGRNESGQNGDGQIGDTAVPSSHEIQSAVKTATPSTPGQEGPGSEHSGEKPAAPASGQISPNQQSLHLNWLILLCYLLTLAAGTLRLTVIRRTIKRLGQSEDGEETAGSGFKPVVKEVIVGIICVILWGILYVRRSSPYELAALILWAGTLLIMAVLLLRTEGRLRQAEGRRET